MWEKEIKEEILMQRREEEGKVRREEKLSWRRNSISGTRLKLLLHHQYLMETDEVAVMAAPVRAVGGYSVLNDSFAWEMVASIVHCIRAAQLAGLWLVTSFFVFASKFVLSTRCRYAMLLVMLTDWTCWCHLHSWWWADNKWGLCGQIDLSICVSHKVSFSFAVLIQPEPG